MASKLEELRAAAKAKAELAYKAEGIERNGTTTQQQQVQTESTAGLPASSSICSSGGSSGSGRAVSTVRPITGSTGNSVDSSLVVHNVSNVQTEVELSPQQFTVVEKIAQVEQLLLRNDPLMPVLLNFSRSDTQPSSCLWKVSYLASFHTA